MGFLNKGITAPAQQGQRNLSFQEAMSMVRQDPVGMLRKKGYNVPDNMTTPEQIIPYLLSTNQVTQDGINQMMSNR